jgi:hypothetical protein
MPPARPSGSRLPPRPEPINPRPFDVRVLRRASRALYIRRRVRGDRAPSAAGIADPNVGAAGGEASQPVGLGLGHIALVGNIAREDDLPAAVATDQITRPNRDRRATLPCVLLVFGSSDFIPRAGCGRYGLAMAMSSSRIRKCSSA